jgi:hypothetical protein
MVNNGYTQLLIDEVTEYLAWDDAKLTGCSLRRDVLEVQLRDLLRDLERENERA